MTNSQYSFIKERHFDNRSKHFLINFLPLDYVLLLSTLSLPKCLIEFCNMALTFECVDEILCCDHSNESSLPVLLHSAILHKESCKLGRNLPLATFGSERVKRKLSLVSLGT